VIIKRSDRDSFDRLFDVLAQGKVAVLLCDTIYGIVGISPETESRIRRIKQRETEKAFISLIPDVSWLERFTDTCLPVSLRDIWPARLTIIFPHRKAGTIALRVPEDAFLRHLIVALDKPLISTSVNTTGQPPLHKIKDIIGQFEQKVDLVVDSGDLEGALPSTIIDLTSSPPRVVRRGAVHIDDIPAT
jgi:L-threonylcarbamoyladenylate synthase